MASIPISVHLETHKNLRALNILRDLPSVADLIELCFSSTMDSEGQRYIQDMRRAGQDSNFLRWATKVAESTSLPLTGYVWEENGKIVGNASLVPFRHNGKHIYLIANVAVHPDFRRRGIARALTERALQHAKQRKVSSTWLHVRDDNQGAIKLYTDLGFRERARRTTWQVAKDQATQQRLNSDTTIGIREPRYWPQQQDWLRRNYPDELAWYQAWNFSPLQPGLWNWLYLAFVDLNVQQWIATRVNDWPTAGQHLEAAAAWIPSMRDSNSLWLAADPKSSPEAVTALLIHARRALSYHTNLTLDYPADELIGAIIDAGFRPVRTLIWMETRSAT
ncbi:MAG TPA: GNAT family N-acetyltransferase [Anaerolineales bacterium]|nr:GNAT family N-acetyltransferase [Anaerolineales bacterium]